MSTLYAPVFRRPTQRGAALVVALVLLMLMSLGAVSLMKGAVNAEVTANNARLRGLAEQAAQVALLHCERLYQAESADLPVLPSQGVDDRWSNPAEWRDGRRYVLPMSALMSDISSFTSYGQDAMPQCMAELEELPDGTEVVIITARGFSPDYSASPNGATLSGAQVWLQSTSFFKDVSE
ncbi:PilX N-terminal domain-containing pilus assembly protein [Ideonella livida]|uniref:Type 4 fimbrial biogenesis protein PilX N-terminal domain-containing protein n=1 Tax=Ideonella livida TaxID=2707176 RepID=A0A7C9TMJ4_9BURK|nr:PilX N-terminal domain-containing pilus assembly protein [Ideonella livida]NDY91726.1 hypothetical protein [Ideonella livida]